MSLEETLHSLRDVDGVQGSFVIAPSGALVAKDLPAVFDGELFSEVGPRIARLYETFMSGGEEMDACLLRYAEHKLYVRKMKAGMIATISAARVNMAALRMVVNLVIRRLDPEIGRISVATPSSAPRIPPPLPSVFPASSAHPVTSATSGASSASAPASAKSAASAKPSAAKSALYSGASPLSSTQPSVTLPDEPRDPAMPLSDRHVRMYRGRPVDD